MSKPKIIAHPSVVIAHCENTEELLMSVYDYGYKQQNYVGSVNLIGGNPEKDGSDKSPRQVLEREIAEEFNPEPAKRGIHKNKFGNDILLWARHIEEVRNELLNGIEAHKDFHAIVTKNIPGGDKAGEAIFSSFYSAISPKVMEMIKKDLLGGRTYTHEGLAGVIKIDDLLKDEKGIWAAAHGTPHILNHYFGTNIPHPKEFQAEPIGNVRDSFIDYFSNFDHYLDVSK